MTDPEHQAIQAFTASFGGPPSVLSRAPGRVALFRLGAGVVPESTADLDDRARVDLARVLQRSENAFVGVSSGLLDQFTVLFGGEGHALTLDCRSFDFARLPLGDPAPAIVVC